MNSPTVCQSDRMKFDITTDRLVVFRLAEHCIQCRADSLMKLGNEATDLM